MMHVSNNTCVSLRVNDTRVVVVKKRKRVVNSTPILNTKNLPMSCAEQSRTRPGETRTAERNKERKKQREREKEEEERKPSVGFRHERSQR